MHMSGIGVPIAYRIGRVILPIRSRSRPDSEKQL